MSFFVIKFTIGKQNLKNELIASQGKKMPESLKTLIRFKIFALLKSQWRNLVCCNFGSCTTRTKNIYQAYETASKFMIT